VNARELFACFANWIVGIIAIAGVVLMFHPGWIGLTLDVLFWSLLFVVFIKCSLVSLLTGEIETTSTIFGSRPVLKSQQPVCFWLNQVVYLAMSAFSAIRIVLSL
jgi:hypothetical protein